LISRVAVRLKWLRRKLGRSHWAARLLGIRPPPGEAELPGLLLIQIDGLSRPEFERALAGGSLPFLARLIRRRHFSVESFYSGVPSSTPAVQGELFHGVRTAVPSFQFLHRATGKVFRMYDAEAAATVEANLAAEGSEPLLKDGSAYSDIYRAGAARSRYCSRDLAPDELLRRLHPFTSILLCLAYAPTILRMLALALLECGLAVVDAVKGLRHRENFFPEVAFIPARVVVCVLLRELIRFQVMLDLERGTQVVHANFLGYDEQAHRRGPDSAFARWTLKGIDRAIRDIYHAAARCRHRDYELIVHSDHGQERCIPYATKHGRGFEEALREVFAEGPLAGREIWTSRFPERLGHALDQLRPMFGLRPSTRPPLGAPDPARQIVVTAMGPLGHLYLPEEIEAPALESCAARLIALAAIPLVLRRLPDGSVRAMNRRGNWSLPADRAEVLGADHPFLDEATADLVRLCAHPDAGDLVVSGWDPRGRPLSFPLENGAHGGPGATETHGFLLLPDRIRRWHLAHLPRTGHRVRGEDLRKIVLHFLGRDGPRVERVPRPPPRDREAAIRVMTYNLHSCLGIDGKVRPERIARVINDFDPDLVAVQEVDAHRPRSGHLDQARRIADHLRMEHAFHAMFEEQKERYGIAIFSRHPFTLVKAGYLTRAAPRRLLSENRGAIWVTLGLAGHPRIHFVNTHFGLGRDERRIQAGQLLGPDWLGGIPEDEPAILCGDLNSGPRSAAYQLLQTRLLDAQVSLPDHRPLPTFSSVKPLFRIDHVFTSRHFAIERVEVPDTPTALLASDHLPLCVELTLHGGSAP
jgi:endonuclease/exonuclease/phosphatase family metal-dependent hydrolase